MVICIRSEFPAVRDQIPVLFPVYKKLIFISTVFFVFKLESVDLFNSDWENYPTFPLNFNSSYLHPTKGNERIIYILLSIPLYHILTCSNNFWWKRRTETTSILECREPQWTQIHLKCMQFGNIYKKIHTYL